MGQADSTTTLVISSAPPVPVATASLAGIVSLSAQTMGAGVKTFSSQPVFTAGTGSGSAQVSGVINVNTTSVGNVGGGTDDLITYSLPANTLSANGKALRITAGGTYNDTTSAGTLQITLLFGGTTLATMTGPAAAVAGHWRVQAEVIRTGAATQIGMSAITARPTTAATAQSVVTTATAPGETLSGAVTIRCQAVAGVNNNDIVQTFLLVEVLN
jgi:hypothetical protein